MVQNVAVVDRLARKIVERHENIHRLVGFNVDHILPDWRGDRIAVASPHLKGVGMKMKGMIHPRSIDDMPLFNGAQVGRDIDAIVGEAFAVDQKRLLAVDAVI